MVLAAAVARQPPQNPTASGAPDAESRVRRSIGGLEEMILPIAANDSAPPIEFEATAPDGTVVRRRFFDNKVAPPDLRDGVAALLPPVNGHDWMFWMVAPTQDAMPDFVPTEGMTFVPARRVR